MSDLIRAHAAELQYLASCKKRYRDALLKEADDGLLRAIVECNHNVIKGVVPLTQHQKTALTRHRKHILALDRDTDLKHLQGTERRRELKAKRKGIVQVGGFLPALLLPLLSAVIGPLAQSAVGAITHSIATRKQRRVHEKQSQQRMKRLQKTRKKK